MVGGLIAASSSHILTISLGCVVPRPRLLPPPFVNAMPRAHYVRAGRIHPPPACFCAPRHRSIARHRQGYFDMILQVGAGTGLLTSSMVLVALKRVVRESSPWPARHRLDCPARAQGAGGGVQHPRRFLATVAITTVCWVARPTSTPNRSRRADQLLEEDPPSGPGWNRSVPQRRPPRKRTRSSRTRAPATTCRWRCSDGLRAAPRSVGAVRVGNFHGRTPRHFPDRRLSCLQRHSGGGVRRTGLIFVVQVTSGRM